MYFKTKKEVVEHLHRVWHDIGADDMYGRAAINDAITCICYGSDDLKEEENSDVHIGIDIRRTEDCI